MAMIPPPFIAEIIYTIILIACCLFIYVKTKELYHLSEHKGIQYFRYTFLFFALAYALRLGVHFVRITHVKGIRPFMPLTLLLITYASTMAILCLWYSNAWKKTKINMLLLNVLALIISLIALIIRDLLAILILQTLLFIPLLIITYREFHKKKKLSLTYASYLLIFGFWLLNVLSIALPRFLVPIKIALYGVSIILFIILTVEVTKRVQ